MIDPAPTAEEQLLLDQVESVLERSLALRDWWKAVDGDDAYRERFPLTTTFNRPDSSFGFFSEAGLPEGPMQVMGNVQEQFFDRPKAVAGRRPGDDHSEHGRRAALWMRDQIREFVLRYFMRVSDFSRPQAYSRQGLEGIPTVLKPLAWGEVEKAQSGGFGYEQVFYKTHDGELGRFADHERHAITDLRDLRLQYQWVILRVEIFGFQFQVAPFGVEYPHGILPVPESTYVVISPDFVVDQEHSAPGELGRFGFGYGFLPSAGPSLLAYGPGQFELAFQLFELEVRKDGEVLSRMAFTANRPKKVVNLPANPVDFGMRTADKMTLGWASRLMEPFIRPEHRPSDDDSPPLDPVDAYVGMANLMTGGMAARRLGISKKQLEIDFLVKHFLQHYNAMAGSLVTWRQIPDWLARDELPQWVESGISS